LQASLQYTVIDLFGMELQLDPSIHAHRLHALSVSRTRSKCEPIERMLRALRLIHRADRLRTDLLFVGGKK
jgi:hypothetical protein